MSNFVHHNFATFKSEFETAFGENICHWIFNNIDIKESPSSHRIDVEKWFCCKSLLRNPDKNFISLCNRLFRFTKNLNGRSPHIYLADQVNGTLKEALHAKKISKKHPDCKVSIISSEFNTASNKRELYTNIKRSVNRKPDLRIIHNNKSTDIHIKANNTFLKSHQLTFRGGRSPEFTSISSGKYHVHLLISPTEYISIKNFNHLDHFISKKEFLNSNNSWGGAGAVRLKFKSNIRDLIKVY